MYTTWQVYLYLDQLRQCVTCSANALIIYSLTKDVEGGGGDRILYIVDFS